MTWPTNFTSPLIVKDPSERTRPIPAPDRHELEICRQTDPEIFPAGSWLRVSVTDWKTTGAGVTAWPYQIPV
jgi:hypothetical protein